MISRRKILSRSRDILNDEYYGKHDGVWFHVDKLFNDHIQEILAKYDQLDDEIWAKIIVMERNRRLAKAYARAPAISINGSEAGFDGYRIGINGFPSLSPDDKTEEIKKNLGKGVKLKMDDSGNILIKRLTRTPVIIKGYMSKSSSSSNSSCSNNNSSTAINKNLTSSSIDHLSDRTSTSDSSLCLDLIKSNGRLEPDKVVKMFDMSRFSQNVERELRTAYPDRRKLERQCISIIAFGRDSSDILNLPSFVMIINIVAIDMLKTRVPAGGLDSGKIPLTRFSPSAFDDDEDDLDLDKEVSVEEVYSSSKTSGGSFGGGAVSRFTDRLKSKSTPNVKSRNANVSSKHSKNTSPNSLNSSSQHSSFISTSTSSSLTTDVSQSKGNKSSKSLKCQPPKLPPRDFPRKLLPRLPTPDYEVSSPASGSEGGETNEEVRNSKSRKGRNKNKGCVNESASTLMLLDTTNHAMSMKMRRSFLQDTVYSCCSSCS